MLYKSAANLFLERTLSLCSLYISVYLFQYCVTNAFENLNDCG